LIPTFIPSVSIKCFSQTHLGYPPLWSIARNFIDPVTRTKIEVVKTEDVRETLLKYIDAESLPREFGGTCSCTSGGDCIPVHDPAQVLAEYKVEAKNLEDSMEMVKMDISYRDTKTIALKAPQDGGIFGWYFHVANYDIRFTIEWYPVDGDKIQSKEVILIPSRLSTHQGSLTVDTAGECRFIFDNSYSLMRGKSINYHISFVTKPSINEPDDRTVITTTTSTLDNPQQTASETTTGEDGINSSK